MKQMKHFIPEISGFECLWASSVGKVQETRAWLATCQGPFSKGLWSPRATLQFPTNSALVIPVFAEVVTKVLTCYSNLGPATQLVAAWGPMQTACHQNPRLPLPGATRCLHNDPSLDLWSPSAGASAGCACGTLPYMEQSLSGRAYSLIGK